MSFVLVIFRRNRILQEGGTGLLELAELSNHILSHPYGKEGGIGLLELAELSSHISHSCGKLLRIFSSCIYYVAFSV